MAIWVAGCTLRCPGCCNPELFAADAGATMPLADIEARLDGQRGRIEGLSILGGEPLQQPAAVAQLLRAAQGRGLGTIVFSGYTLAEARTRPGFETVWSQLDTLIDGRYESGSTELRRRFIGSSNQRLHHRTPRYADEALWRGPTRVEVRIDARGQVEAHGLPRAVARLRRAAETS